MTSTDTESSVAEHVTRVWDTDIVPELCEYIAIPNVSKAYEPEWKSLGHMDRAVHHIRRWYCLFPLRPAASQKCR